MKHITLNDVLAMKHITLNDVLEKFSTKRMLIRITA